MKIQEYVEGLETNTIALGAASLALKFFALRMIQHVQRGGRLDEASFASIKAASVQELKSIAVEGQGVSVEQEAEGLNRGLAFLVEMLDDVITRAGS